MADFYAQQPTKIERKIGSTTYIVASHFAEKGSTAVAKIKRLIDIDTKNSSLRPKV